MIRYICLFLFCAASIFWVGCDRIQEVITSEAIKSDERSIDDLELRITLNRDVSLSEGTIIRIHLDTIKEKGHIVYKINDKSGSIDIDYLKEAIDYEFEPVDDSYY